jgi:hypothetical protein
MWMWMREGGWDPPQICSNLLPFRGKCNYGGKTFAPPHLHYMFGTLGVNLLHLPHLPNRAMVTTPTLVLWGSPAFQEERKVIG